MQNYRIFLLSLVFLTAAASASSFKDGKYYNQDVVKLATWLMKAVNNRDPALCSGIVTKRNSEIINSLLGLPKNLNDVGKKCGEKIGFLCPLASAKGMWNRVTRTGFILPTQKTPNPIFGFSVRRGYKCKDILCGDHSQ